MCLRMGVFILNIEYVLGTVTKLSTATTVISSQGKEEIKHR